MDGQTCFDTSMIVASNIINLIIIIALFTILGILLKRTATKKKVEKNGKDTLEMLDDVE